MKKIKDRTLWCIGYDKLMSQNTYDGFIYSECGDIILGVVNNNRTEFSPSFLGRDKPMIPCVPYIIGKFIHDKPIELCPLL